MALDLNDGRRSSRAERQGATAMVALKLAATVRRRLQVRTEAGSSPVGRSPETRPQALRPRAAEDTVAEVCRGANVANHAPL